RDLSHNDGSSAAEMAFEKKPREIRPERQGESEISRKVRPVDEIQAEVLGSVSIGLLKVACREAQSMTGLELENWSSLAGSGEIFRRMLGLSEAGWADGRAKVGVYAASAILATVLEKHIRDPQQISKPGGYFRAMVDRAIDGQLNLERSLFGLAESNYGNLGSQL
ncbi:MAG: plasmid replication protein RepCa2, partial [Rhizobiaceae bacterium]|nr:plasmid replication protein RepCa2 [Rhizobiaceae bacterium]